MDTEIRYLVEMLALNDSQSALRELYVRFSARIYRYVFLYVRDSCDADEIVSDCFYAVWKNRKRLLGVNNFQAYLFRVAKFKAVDAFRKKKMNTVNCEDIDMDLFVNADTTPEDDCISVETAKTIDRAIDTLPPKCKMVFKLVREDRMAHKEAADFLDISVKTLQVHLSLAMRKIREVLENKETC